MGTPQPGKTAVPELTKKGFCVLSFTDHGNFPKE
jgi:hypothetical protein